MMMDMGSEMEKCDMGSGDKGSEAEDYALDDKETSKVSSAIAMLKPLADKAGVSVAELIEKVEGPDEDDAGESEDDGSKVAMIVARMKAKGDESNTEG